MRAVHSTLLAGARLPYISQLARILSDQEPAISLFFAPQPWVFCDELQGPKIAASDANMSWTAYEWELR